MSFYERKFDECKIYTNGLKSTKTEKFVQEYRRLFLKVVRKEKKTVDNRVTLCGCVCAGDMGSTTRFAVTISGCNVKHKPDNKM